MKKKKSKKKPPPLAGVTLPPLPAVNRGNRWQCTRKDCYRKPVNFGDTCGCCGQKRP